MFDVLIAIAVVVLVIGRQIAGGPLRARRLLVLPLALVVVGLTRLGGHHVGAADIVVLTASALVSAGIGYRQGSIMELENRDGGLWGRMPVRGLVLWAALVLSRLAAVAAAHASGAHVAASLTPMILVLGVNRLTQSAVIAYRARAARIPFAPEPGGGGSLLGRLDGTSRGAGGGFGQAAWGGARPRRRRSRV